MIAHTKQRETGPLTHPTKSNIPVILETRVVCGTGGGPEKTILNSPRYLEPAGYKTLCAYMHPPGDPGFEVLRRRAQEWNAPLLSVPDRGPLDMKVVSQLLDVCRRERVNIWHGHDYKSNALGLLLQRLWPMRLVTTVHGWTVEAARTPLYYGIDRLCLRWYEKVICVSQDLFDQCLLAGVSKRKCVLVENAIDTTDFARTNSSEAAKRQLGLNPNRLLVGAVGRLSPEKDFDLLIRCLNRLIINGVDLEAVIVGEGDEKTRLERLVAELGCENRIHLMGYRPDPRPVFEAMDVFVLSSRREGLPNVLLEALAMEVPVVATRIAGVPHLICDGQNGLLVQPGDSDSLTSALSRLLTDAALRTTLAQAGRHTVEARYSFEMRMKKISAIYDSVLNRRRAT